MFFFFFFFFPHGSFAPKGSHKGVHRFLPDPIPPDKYKRKTHPSAPPPQFSPTEGQDRQFPFPSAPRFAKTALSAGIPLAGWNARPAGPVKGNHAVAVAQAVPVTSNAMKRPLLGEKGTGWVDFGGAHAFSHQIWGDSGEQTPAQPTLWPAGGRQRAAFLGRLRTSSGATTATSKGSGDDSQPEARDARVGALLVSASLDRCYARVPFWLVPSGWFPFGLLPRLFRHSETGSLTFPRWLKPFTCRTQSPFGERTMPRFAWQFGQDSGTPTSARSSNTTHLLRRVCVMPEKHRAQLLARNLRRPPQLQF